MQKFKIMDRTPGHATGTFNGFMNSEGSRLPMFLMGDHLPCRGWTGSFDEATAMVDKIVESQGENASHLELVIEEA